MPQPKKILVLETVQEESSESFDEDSLDLEDMTLLAMKFRNFLKFSKIENKKKPLDLVSNPRVNTVRIHEIGNNLREKKERKKKTRLSVPIWEKGYRDINLEMHSLFVYQYLYIYMMT